MSTTIYEAQPVPVYQIVEADGCVLRLNTVTGETWQLSGLEWERIEEPESK